ncbi:aminotransferase class I/II-fold pyridoxal phosphate-dependent enzyme [Streptomyces sp. ST2-7A]|uniref:aminotransferase class I/II-fold pyridoxal phosphate-dependent enzyme n=1 Tax=Streptomyces sp. ST2-7A TaxID=2907214 RepID=UPI001F3FE658|nr:aminotransferase class I/II-fold pyridoxal phosphate-dependent enzyme [Streptomyces sp. ST2-7A]MCE7079387.1 aminotransferase class I/II-fold pyridoxal phosphate-dependent enzyme [Streptomyces sp. ST2-7A]
MEAYRITGRRASEIVADIEHGVESGALPPDTALPPMRTLATRLGINPNTVAAAYRTLRERGVVETAGRRGTRVRRRAAGRESRGMPVPPGVRDLASGNPDPALLPDPRVALAEVAARAASQPVLYGEPPVGPELALVARESLRADGVPEGPLAVTSGALDAIERVLLTRLRPGDPVAVEDPGWGGLLDLLSTLGLRPVAMAVDDEGPLPEALEHALTSGVRACVITARAQNPTGAAVSAARAGALRPLLAAFPETLLIEDDHGHGIVSAPLNPLGGLGTHWALVRSVAKSLGPDLRVAVLTGDPVTVRDVAARIGAGPGWVSRILQDTVALLWPDRARPDGPAPVSYDTRRGLLCDALARRGVAARGRTGPNLWIPVPDETAAVAGMLAAGWAVAPGSRYRLESGPGIRLTVSSLAPEEMDRVADDLAAVLAPAPGTRPG